MRIAARLPHVFALAAVLALGLLVPVGDANHSRLQLVGPGAPNGTTFAAASADGTKVFFTTVDSLEPGDTDTRTDIYERFGSTIRRISTGSSGGNAALNAFFGAISSDGSHVLFTTSEQLEPGDTDERVDIYERFGSTTTRISSGSSGGNAAENATFRLASANGTRVFFTTREQLEPGDTDAQADIYERSGSTTTRISTGPSGGNAAFDPTLVSVSTDGARAFFTTSEQLTGNDNDTLRDIYERTGSTTALSSTGTSGGNSHSAQYRGTSDDGTRVFFETAEQIEPGDTDTQIDIYERQGSTTRQISTGSSGGNGGLVVYFKGASDDGTRVFFETAEQLEPGDTDTKIDVYERFGSTTTRISTGSSGGNGYEALFSGASKDGTRVYFFTSESLEPGDTWGSDLYERFGSTSKRISVGEPGSSGGAEDGGALFAKVSDDGLRVFFHTWEPLVPSDNGTYGLDVYERFGSTTTLLSPGTRANHDTSFVGASDDGTRVFFWSDAQIRPDDTNDEYDVYVADFASTAPYVRPIGATPLRIALVPAYEECTSPNSTHAAPFAGGSCDPPKLASDEGGHLTVGTPDANGAPAKSSGSVLIRVHPGTPGGADDADTSLEVSLKDVRYQGSLSDYTGELRLNTELRITDQANGPDGSLPATGMDVPLDVTVPCAATGDTTIGGSCSISTTLDSLLGPNAVPEGKRTLYDMVGGVDVFDGGIDGDVDTRGDDALFAIGGFFVP